MACHYTRITINRIIQVIQPGPTNEALTPTTMG